MMPTTRQRIAFVGVGFTELTRTPDRPAEDLNIAACRMAMADAGIDPALVDGVSFQSYTFQTLDTARVIDGLGLKDVRFQFDGPFSFGSAGIAAEALDRGDCKAVLVVRGSDSISPISFPPID